MESKKADSRLLDNINTNYCSTALEAVSLKSVKTYLREWVGCAVNVIVDLFVVVGESVSCVDEMSCKSDRNVEADGLLEPY